MTSTFAIGVAGYVANCAHDGTERGRILRRRLDAMQAHMDAIAGPRHHYVNLPRGNVAPRLEEITA